MYLYMNMYMCLHKCVFVHVSVPMCLYVNVSVCECVYLYVSADMSAYAVAHCHCLTPTSGTFSLGGDPNSYFQIQIYWLHITIIP